MKRNAGRPKGTTKGERVQLAIRFEPQYARLIQTAKNRKGMAQADYLKTLIILGDKHIPNKPKVVIRMTTVRPQSI